MYTDLILNLVCYFVFFLCLNNEQTDYTLGMRFMSLFVCLTDKC